jgi:hypothetical protein
MKTQTLTNDYHATITASVSPAEAFQDICEVSAWWAKNFKGSAKKKGDLFTVSFGETFVDFSIKDLISDKMVVWEVVDCNLHWLKDKKEWKGTEIVWELSSSNGSTRIDMTHIGLVPEVECYDACETGWNHHIKDSLFKLLTEKKGMPE